MILQCLLRDDSDKGKALSNFAKNYILYEWWKFVGRFQAVFRLLMRVRNTPQIDDCVTFEKKVCRIDEIGREMSLDLDCE